MWLLTTALFVYFLIYLPWLYRAAGELPVLCPCFSDLRSFTATCDLARLAAAHFLLQPDGFTQAEMAAACGRLLGWPLGRVAVRIPGDGLYYTHLAARQEAYGCISVPPRCLR